MPASRWQRLPMFQKTFISTRGSNGDSCHHAPTSKSEVAAAHKSGTAEKESSLRNDNISAHKNCQQEPSRSPGSTQQVHHRSKTGREQVENRYIGGRMQVQTIYKHTVNTTHAPTSASPHTTDGTNTDPFVSHLPPISPGTAYYYRAYTTNAMGTAYGEERTLLKN